MTAAKRTWTTQDEANTYSTYEVLLLRSVRTLEHLGKITAQRDALREVLRGCYTNAVYLNSGFTAPVYRDMLATIAENCRAALALADGAE